MAFVVVISWNPADVPPFGYEIYVSRPYKSKRKAWEYVQAVIRHADANDDVDLYDLAVFEGRPKHIHVDHEARRVSDPALWRLHGRETSYRGMFC